MVTEGEAIHSDHAVEVSSGRSSHASDEGPNGKGAASSRRDSMGDKRQKNQLQMMLAFTDEGRSEAPKARREGTESLTAKGARESPAIPEQVMEEVCEREPQAGLATSEVEQGESGGRRHACRRIARLPETALASNPGTAAARDLQAETGEAGGNPEAGRRSAKTGHSGAGSVYPAGGDAVKSYCTCQSRSVL
jgi:hypothetical protein